MSDSDLHLGSSSLRASGIPAPLRVALILLAALLALAAGVSGFLLPQLYAPLVVGGAFVAALATLFWLRKPAWALYVTVFVVLLPIGLIPPGIHSQINRTMTVLSLVVWLVDTITRRRRIVFSASAVWMLGFLAWSSLTLLWAGNLDRASNALQTYILRFLLFLFLLPNVIRSQDNLRGLMNALAIHGWVVILATLFSVLQTGWAPGLRLKVFGENENGLGILLLVGLPGVLAWAGRGSERWAALSKVAALSYIMLSIAIVAMTGSRGSSLSLVAVLATLLLWKPTRAYGAAGLVVLVIAALGASFIFSTLVERILVQRGDTMLGGREALWKAAWMVITDYPWRGIGIGNAPYAIKGYVEQMRSIWGADITPVHNPVLTIWTETGIPGLALYMGGLLTAVVQFVRCFSRLRKTRGRSVQQTGATRYLLSYCAVIAGVFIGYMLSWIKGGGMESDYSFFMMLGLLIAPQYLARRPEPDAAQPQPQRADRGPYGQ
jgi:putative inorganic carbon (HCO3(-)) transporter